VFTLTVADAMPGDDTLTLSTPPQLVVSVPEKMVIGVAPGW
jgi:hypothetical protein